MAADDHSTGSSGDWPPRRYVRTGAGQVVHRSGCFLALGGQPWEWAEGMTPSELAEDPRSATLRQCDLCMPEDLWPSEAEAERPPAQLPLLERVRLAHEHLTRAVQLDLDKAAWLADRGDLHAAANAQRTAALWEQSAAVLAHYVPEILDENPSGGPGRP